MATIPMIDAPTQVLEGAQMQQFAASNVEPIKNFTGQQLQAQGAATEKAGLTVLKIGQRLDDEINDARGKEMYNIAAEKFDALEAQFGELKGKDAADARGRITDELKKVFKDVGDMAENDVQKAIYQQAAAVRLRTSSTMVQKHAITQLGVYDINEQKSQIENNILAGAKVWDTYKQKDAEGNDSGDYNTYLGAAIVGANRLADKAGLPADSEQRKDVIIGAKTKLVDTVVRNLVATDKGGQAKEFLDFSIKRGDVSEAKKDELLNLVKVSTTKEEAFNLSLTLKGGLEQKLKTIDDMASNGKISVDVRDQVAQRLEHDYARRKQMENESNASAMGNFQDWVIKNPGKPITDAPTELYAWAKNKGHLAGLDAFAKREGAASDRQTELKLRGDLLNLAMNDPDTFIAKFKETKFVDNFDLGATGIKEMQNLAADMLNNNGKFKSAFDQKVLQDAIPAGILKNKDKKDAFVAIMSEASNDWIKANPGKKPDGAAYQTVITSANQEWVQIGSLWNSKVPAYEARATRATNAVPQSFYNGMKATGANDDEIKRAWAIKQGIAK